MIVFDLKEVSFGYGAERKALDRVSLAVREGESVTVIGANGSGKSTLLFVLDGLLRPASGTASIFGEERPGGFPPDLRRRISLLFQNPQAQLFLLTVEDEIAFGPRQMGLAEDEINRRTCEILDLLDIRRLRGSSPWDLSEGEMKKVALGACLGANPDVLLLDEPLGSLDPRSQAEIVDLIIALRDAGKTIVTATHDLGIIGDLSERTVVIGENHRVLKEGPPAEMLADRELLLRANLIHARRSGPKTTAGSRAGGGAG